MRHAIQALLDKTSDHNLQIFRIFEEYISVLTERQNSSYKAFRDTQNEKIGDLETEKHVHNKEDLNDLLELRDIEDGKVTSAPHHSPKSSRGLTNAVLDDRARHT